MVRIKVLIYSCYMMQFKKTTTAKHCNSSCERTLWCTQQVHLPWVWLTGRCKSPERLVSDCCSLSSWQAVEDITHHEFISTAHLMGSCHKNTSQCLCVSGSLAALADVQQSNTGELQSAGLKCNQTSPQPVEFISINDITDPLRDNHFHLNCFGHKFVCSSA